MRSPSSVPPNRVPLGSAPPDLVFSSGLASPSGLASSSVPPSSIGSAAPSGCAPSHSPVLSVVIPLYNVAAYLPQALASIRAQTLADYEAILVDDGSVDGTAQVAQGVACQDGRFRYVRQEHCGAAAARNRGMGMATGTYLLFLDGDDLFERVMFERMVACLDESGADFCLCRHLSFNSETGVPIPDSSPRLRFKGPQEARRYLPDLCRAVTTAPWDKMYRREYVESVRVAFQSIPVSNDVYFTLVTAALSSRAYFLDEVLVRYRVGSGTSLQDGRGRHPTCSIQARRAAFDEIVRRGRGDAVGDSFRCQYVGAVWGMARDARDPGDIALLLALYREIEGSFARACGPCVALRFGPKELLKFWLLRWCYLNVSPQGLAWSVRGQRRERTAGRTPRIVVWAGVFRLMAAAAVGL